MKLLYYIGLFWFSTAQDINFLPHTSIYSSFVYGSDLYQDQIFGALLNAIMILNITTGQVIYQRPLAEQAQFVLVSGDSVFLGGNNITVLAARNPQLASLPSYFAYGPIANMVANDEFLFSGGFMLWLDKWNINTMQREQLIYLSGFEIGLYNMALYNDTLLISGLHVYGVPYNYIQQRNIYDLNQLVYTFSQPANGNAGLVVAGDLLFASNGNYISKYNMTSKELMATFQNHSLGITGLTFGQNYLFSGSYDNTWIQWEPETGEILRRIDINNIVDGLLVAAPYLIVNVNGGLWKYLIPELIIGFNNKAATKTIGMQSTSIIQHVTQTQAHSTIQAIETSSAAFQTLSFSISTSSATKNTFVPTRSLFGDIISFPSIYIILILVVIFIFIVGCLIGLYVIIIRRKKSSQKEKNQLNVTTNISETTLTFNPASDIKSNISISMPVHEISSSNTTTTSTITITNTSTFNNTKTTLYTTQGVYAIPAYLQIDNGKVITLKQIAKGGQGSIYLGRILEENDQVIIKSTGLSFEQLNPKQQNNFYQELSIIDYFKDKNGFVKLRGYTLQPAALILRFYPLGNLENLIKRKLSFLDSQMSKGSIIYFLYRISKAIYELHDAGFVHCDLKPQNILLDVDSNGLLDPVLTDFGITQIVSGKVLQVKAMTIETLKGFSVHYAAPEQIRQAREKRIIPNHENIIKKRDIYAIAGILYAFFMSQEPWHY